MTKAGEKILRGAREALAFAKGARDGYVVHIPAEIDVAKIRKAMKMSQREFAGRFGFAVDAVQNWEQGRRAPDGAARAYLQVIAREPAAVQRALRAG
ncbi:MAG: helix-turn-helix domain-containing protein [Tagaea sp.]